MEAIISLTEPFLAEPIFKIVFLNMYTTEPISITVKYWIFESW